MEISASMVKELREKTGAGMMDCKKALQETEGDMDQAIDLLREKGLAKAAKKSDRIASEGLVDICISEDGTKAAIVEVNSETDFVAKNAEFKTFVSDVASFVLSSNIASVEELLAASFPGSSETVQETLNSKIATIGENMNIRRFAKFEGQGTRAVGYIHGAGKIGVLVELRTDASAAEVAEVGKDVAMQIAAMNPKYISRNDVDQEYLEHEKQILTQQALNEGKPAEIVEKMVVGRLNKQINEVCVLEQAFVKNPDLTIAKYIDAEAKKLGKSIELVNMVRFEVGEGIEKKSEDFAEEVAKQLKK